jgi:hypothetical protein
VVQIAAGLNAGYAQTPPPHSGATRNAFAFSLSFETKLSDRFSLCPEISYVQRGVKTNLMTLGGVTVAGDVRLDTLELPLLLKARFSLARGWKLFTTGGPWIGLLLNREVEVLGLIQADLGQRFKQVDAGVLLGSGVEYEIHRDFAVVGQLRYSLGFVNLDSSGSSFYTRGIQLLLGVQFRL